MVAPVRLNMLILPKSASEPDVLAVTEINCVKAE